MSAIREALAWGDFDGWITSEDGGHVAIEDLRAAALAELGALEAVAEAARTPDEHGKNCRCGLRGALARLAAVQDGQTERERAQHGSVHPDDRERPVAADHGSQGETPSRSVCPCRVHGDPDGDCGENCR